MNLANRQLKPGDMLESDIGLRLEVLKSIGIGGMGEVWLVREKSTKIQFAMKTPKVSDSENADEIIKRFYFEGEHWILLNKHPNIVSCFHIDKIAS